MQFEEFDKKVRQAADQHHPNYDEKAWTKMEKLLDRHLPPKDDRRRMIIFFLLGFLLLGGGAWLVISKPWQKTEPTLSTINNPQTTEAGPSGGSKAGISPGDKKQDQATQPASTKDNTAPVIGDIVVGKQQESPAAVLTNKQNKTLPAHTAKDDQLAIDVTDPGVMKTNKNKSNRQDALIIASDNEQKKEMSEVDKSKTQLAPPVTENAIVNKVSEEKKEKITDQPKTAEEKAFTKKNSSKNRKNNSFFFSLSAGPDISSVGMDNPGKVKLVSGAGFGYTFHDRWTLRTGFYTGTKVYTAAPDEYKPSVPPPNPTYLYEIDADCKVYEIPVSLAYTISRSEKHSSFVSAGLSSYIMKKERYVYLYKYPGGQTYTYNWELEDKNKHYFSVVTISGGYQRRINKLISVAAEPYVKLPLAGVGFGKIKLNSAGILLSVQISPFQRGAKK